MGYGIGTASTRPVRPVTPRAPIAPRPDNRGGPFGASPAFPSLASPARPRPAAAPAAPTYTNDQVTQSLAANPHAAGSNGSLFAYQGQPQIAAAVSPPVNPAPVAPVAPNVSYDYNADPILAQTRALSGKNRGDAQSSALAARKQLAIDYNDTALANQIGDPATAQAAAGNQFGVLKQLERSYGQGAHNLDEDLNNQNLFYGGRRIQEQGNLLHDYQGQQAAAAGQEQGLLGGIGDQLTAALSAADAADIQAQQQAASNAAAAAAAAGVDPGAAAGTPTLGATDPVAAALTAGATGNIDPNPPGTPQAPVDAQPIDYSLASMLFPTPNTELVNPGAFEPPPAAPAEPAVPIDYSLASQLFPTAGTPLLDPSAFPPQQQDGGLGQLAPDPITQALAGLTPQQRRRIQEGF